MSKFWTDVLTAWCELNFDYQTGAFDQLLWCNSYIRIGNQPVVNIKAIKKGLVWLHQLYKEGRRLTFTEAREKYGLNYLELNSLYSAIPTKWEEELLQANVENRTKSFYKWCMEKKNLANFIYRYRIEDSGSVHQICDKWKKQLIEFDAPQIGQALKVLYAATNVPKLRSFQYRLIHNAVITNTNLHKWGLGSPNCSFCSKDEENYVHLFCECIAVVPIWEECKSLGQQLSNDNILLTNENILMNTCSKPCSVVNLLVLIAKQYIYRSRCLKMVPSIYQYRHEVFSTRNIEKYIATKNKKLHAYAKKWCKDTQSDQINNLDEYVRSYLTEI